MSYKEKNTNRPPIITIAGHIDHGKTTFLNYIRKVENPIKEHGGITQQLNAYNIKTKYGTMTFIDTPGHSAFNVIRIESIKNSDIVILIISIDDGVKPQTIESVEIAKKYNIPIIVCLNKIDKIESENKKEKIINELSSLGLIQEAWGGDTFFSYISSKTGAGIDKLFELINIQTELMNLTYRSEGLADGIILDNKMDNNQGIITSIIIKNGKLKKGDFIKTQNDYGKVKIIMCENKKINEAIPSMYVEIVGLKNNQKIGSSFECIKNIKKRTKVSSNEINETKNTYLAEDIIKKMTSAKEKKLNIIIKTDVQGSIDVLKESITNIVTDKIKINLIKIDIGIITKSDIDLASTTKSIIIGFKNKNSQQTNKLIQNKNITFKSFMLIHDLIFYINDTIKNLTEEDKKEILIGVADIKKIFTQEKNTIAGCVVIQGKIKQNSIIKIFRKNNLVHKGAIASIKVFKNQVAEVTQGNECGINIKDYSSIQVHDKIKAYIQE